MSSGDKIEIWLYCNDKAAMNFDFFDFSVTLYYGLSSGEIAGIVIGCIAVSLILTGISIRSIRSCKKKTQTLSNNPPNDDILSKDARLAVGQSDKDDNNSVSV